LIAQANAIELNGFAPEAAFELKLGRLNQKYEGRLVSGLA
jgi:hypothetical protein